jgi:Tfp pilus assembly pilus retraction ATPase PilT
LKPEIKDESSFAGFLKGYSRGNVQLQQKIDELLSDEIDRLSHTVEEISQVFEPGHYDTIRANLKQSVSLLNNNDLSNQEKIASFSRVFELVIVMCKAIQSTLDEPRQASLRRLFNKFLIEYLTIVKKIGNNQLQENALRLADKIDSP